MDPVSETEAVLFFVSVVNLQPWQQMLECLILLVRILLVTNFYSKICFHMYSLSSDHHNHICYDIKVL